MSRSLVDAWVLLFISAVFTIGCNLVNAFSDGSPSCTSDAHVLRMMSDGTDNVDGVTFTFGAVKRLPHDDPDLMRFVLHAHPEPMSYRGFLIYAVDEDGNRVGRFEQLDASGAKLVDNDDCREGHTITHSTADDKEANNIFHWRAPPSFHRIKSVTFLGSVVVKFNEWYLLESRTAVVEP